MNTLLLSILVAMCSAMLVAGKAFNPAMWNLSFKDNDDMFEKKSEPIAAPVWFLKTEKMKKGGPVPASLWYSQTDDDDWRRKKAAPFWNNNKIDANIPGKSLVSP